VDVATIIYPNESIPLSDPGQSIADQLRTTSVQNTILQQTYASVDTSSITVVGGPVVAPSENILGIPLWVWIVIAVAVIFVIFVVILAIVLKREKAKKPWQEFV